MKKEGLKRYSKLFTEVEFRDKLIEQFKKQIYDYIKKHTPRLVSLEEIKDYVYDGDSLDLILNDLVTNGKIEKLQGTTTNGGLVPLKKQGVKEYIDMMKKHYPSFKPIIVDCFKIK